MRKLRLPQTKAKYANVKHQKMVTAMIVLSANTVLLLFVCFAFFRGFKYLSVPLLYFTAMIMYAIIRRKHRIKKMIIPAINGLTGIGLASAIMSNNEMTPRFIARIEWTWFGHDQYAVLWFVFWITYCAVVIPRIFRTSQSIYYRSESANHHSSRIL